MKLIWEPSDIEPGVLVAARGPSGKFSMPSVVAYQISGDGEQVYGLCDLDSGCFMEFDNGSKEALAGKLTDGGYLPVTKQLFEGVAAPGLLDNRMRMPVVTFTRVDTSIDSESYHPVY